jgi:hypothetical protein
MQTSGRLVLAALLLAAVPAAAETPYNCHPGFAPRVKVSADHSQLRFGGNLQTPAGFDPLTNGLDVVVSYEPETDPANIVFSASLPKTGFQALPNGVLYRDTAGTVAGVTYVRIAGPPGAQKAKLRRSGSPLAGPFPAGSLRVVLSSGAGACVRTCGSLCHLTNASRLVCHASGSPALCGVRSGCELIGAADDGGPGGHCMLPYPTAVFEADDPSTVTGKRIEYGPLAMPANANGVHISPAAYRTFDGYSPGTIIEAHFLAGVDLAASNVPPITDFAASLAAGSPTVLIEADSPGCVRVEHFGENDVSIGTGNLPIHPPNQAFIIRPGRRLKNGTRYIVALRSLIDQNAMPIDAPVGFAALRDGTPAIPALEARRPAFASIFNKLETDCGIPRSTLTLAWDFTTASDDAIERWLLHMRDETFAAMGLNAPSFTVNTVEDNPFSGDTRVCRRVTGTYQVPLYTTFDGAGSVLNIDPMTNLPVQNGVTNAPFTAIIPCSLVGPPAHAGRPVYYGHGLLGSGFSEVSADHLRTLANTYGFVVVATDWKGMAADDYANIINTILPDLTNFRELAERLNQGQLNQLVLGHLMGAPDGLSADPAFKFDDGMGGMASVIDPSDVFYYGCSQGGIMGGVVMAVTQETTRGVLCVPAANFSTLLQRSVDFAPFFNALRTYYPDDLVRSIGFPLLQQLWDRSEPNGWYHHTLSDPLPGTPVHKILVHMATSDAEVANIATKIMVHSMGIPQLTPVVGSYFGISEMAASFDGSAMHESNEGDPTPPLTNTPPPNNGAHGNMRKRPAIQAEIDRFLRTGGDVENFCSGVCDPE